jgi:hypothetical protein
VQPKSVSKYRSEWLINTPLHQQAAPPTTCCTAFQHTGHLRPRRGGDRLLLLPLLLRLRLLVPLLELLPLLLELLLLRLLLLRLLLRLLPRRGAGELARLPAPCSRNGTADYEVEATM